MTTNVYAEVDLEMKAKALANCDITTKVEPSKSWREQPELMEFVRSLQLDRLFGAKRGFILLLRFKPYAPRFP